MCWHADVFWLNVLSIQLINPATLMALCDDKMKTACPKITEAFNLNPEYIFIFLTASVLTTSVCQRNQKEFEKAQKLAHRKTSDYFFPPRMLKRKGLSCKDEARTPLTRNHTISRKLPSVLKLHFKVTVSPITTGGRGSMVTVK